MRATVSPQLVFAESGATQVPWWSGRVGSDSSWLGTMQARPLQVISNHQLLETWPARTTPNRLACQSHLPRHTARGGRLTTTRLYLPSETSKGVCEGIVNCKGALGTLRW